MGTTVFRTKYKPLDKYAHARNLTVFQSFQIVLQSTGRVSPVNIYGPGALLPLPSCQRPVSRHPKPGWAPGHTPAATAAPVSPCARHEAGAVSAASHE